MAEKSNPGFVVLLDFYEPLQCLTDAQKGQVFDACFAYHLGQDPALNDPLVRMAFSFIKPFFDRQCEAYERKCEQNRANAKKKYEDKRTDADGCDRKRTDATASDGTQIKVKEESKEEVKPKESTPLPPAGGQRAHAKEKKTPYGQFGNVLLTDKEYQSLQDEFGITGAQERIDNLDEYIASKGTRYKSHYATILSWNRRDSQKPQPVMRQARLSEAEERQRHNDEVCRQVSAELEAINSPF